MKKCPKQNEAGRKYELRNLFNSELFDSVSEPELEDLPDNYDFGELKERAEMQLLNDKINTALRAFYRYMNDTAKLHGLTRSNFAVVHGMNHWENYSSALDVATLAKIAIRTHALFTEIMNTKEHVVASKLVAGHIYRWDNTNRLLWDTSGSRGKSAFQGVKTGNTPWAGPCLCANYRDDGFDLIVVVLNCKTPEARFSEVPKLCRWAVNKIMRVRRTNLRPAVKKRLLRNMVHV